MNDRLRKLTVTAVGIALFVALSLCLQVPVFQNYYLCLGYVAMAVYCYSFGAVSGTIVGTLGVVLYCLLTSGLRGMPGWALGNVVIGVVLGDVFAKTKGMKRKVFQYGIWALAVVVSVAAGILGVKSLVDALIKAQPVWQRMVMNVYAFVADTIVLLVSLPICVLVDVHARKLWGAEGKKA